MSRLVGLAGALAALALATGCSVRRIEQGVYHSPKGYRVTLPGPGWEVVDASRADLEVRRRDGAAGMVAHATCGDAARRSPSALVGALLAGLRDRRLLEREQVSLDGRPASHAVVEARGAPRSGPVRIETYTVVGERCVYDLLYAAPPDAFDTWRGDFRGFAASFRTEE